MTKFLYQDATLFKTMLDNILIKFTFNLKEIAEN